MRAFRPSELSCIRALRLLRFHPRHLLRIALAPILAMAYGFILLYTKDELTYVLDLPVNKTAARKSNGVAEFLMPAGLLYATCFSITLQRVTDKKSNVGLAFAACCHYFESTLTGIINLDISNTEKLYILETYKQLFIMFLKSLAGPCLQNTSSLKPSRNFREESQQLWKLVESVSCGCGFQEKLRDQLVSNVNDMAKTVSELRENLTQRLHPLEWLFLQALAIFSYFGVLFIETQSQRMGLVMCLITVASISLLCMAIADLDSPFSGFFVVKVERLLVLSDTLEEAYAKTGGVDWLET